MRSSSYRIANWGRREVDHIICIAHQADGKLHNERRERSRGDKKKQCSHWFRVHDPCGRQCWKLAARPRHQSRITITIVCPVRTHCSTSFTVPCSASVPSLGRRQHAANRLNDSIVIYSLACPTRSFPGVSGRLRWVDCRKIESKMARRCLVFALRGTVWPPVGTFLPVGAES